jgi:hypothetical protein
MRLAMDKYLNASPADEKVGPKKKMQTSVGKRMRTMIIGVMSKEMYFSASLDTLLTSTKLPLAQEWEKAGKALSDTARPTAPTAQSRYLAAAITDAGGVAYGPINSLSILFETVSRMAIGAIGANAR